MFSFFTVMVEKPRKPTRQGRSEKRKHATHNQSQCTPPTNRDTRSQEKRVGEKAAEPAQPHSRKAGATANTRHKAGERKVIPEPEPQQLLPKLNQGSANQRRAPQKVEKGMI